MGLPGRAAADLVYATVDHFGQNEFGTLDLSTGQFTEIFAPVTDLPIFALGYGPNNELYGVSDDGEVYLINPTQKQATDVGNVNEYVIGGASFGGTLYLVTGDSPSNLLTYNPVTGVASPTLAMSIANSSPVQGFNADGLVAVSPGGTLYVSGIGSSFSDSVFTTNTSTGAVTQLDTAGTGVNLIAGVFDGTTLYGIDSANIIWQIGTSDGSLSSKTPIIGLNDGDFIGAVAAIQSVQSVPEANSLVLMAIGAVALGVASRVRTASRRPKSASGRSQHCHSAPSA